MRSYTRVLYCFMFLFLLACSDSSSSSCLSDRDCLDGQICQSGRCVEFEGKKPLDGDDVTDGDDWADGDIRVDGDTPLDGDIPNDHDDPADGDILVDGDTPLEGDIPNDHDDPADGDILADGDTPADADDPTDGDGSDGDMEVCASGCLISTICYEDGDLNPENACKICSVAYAADAWTLVEAGAACDDGNLCTINDTCGASGVCAGTPNICSSYGVCNPSDGTCTCDNPHMTENCSVCAPGFGNYPDCDECAAGLGNYPDCDECAAGLENYPNCQPVLSCTGGVCTDPATGLQWQQTPTGGRMSWSNAITHCQNLNLSGMGWRLPTISELRSLIRGCPATETGGRCNVQNGGCLSWSCWDSSCRGCSVDQGPANGCYWPSSLSGRCWVYWSSSPVEDYAGHAWFVYFSDGYVDYGYGYVDCYNYVRCVR